MIQVELNKIIIDEKRQDQIIVLKEKGGNRQLPIIIGFLEASSIKLKLAGIEPPRPMTHDLVTLIVKGLGARLERLIIDRLVDNTFHAKLELAAKDSQIILVDSRPSDGIALAVRMEAPIYVAEEVMDKASLSEGK